MNRVKSRTYTGDSQNTPAVNYYYDSQTLPAGAPTFARGKSIGRLVAACYGGATASAGSYSGYDALGRVNTSVQQTDGQNYGFGYGYNLASETTSQTYPSGRLVVTDYDTAGRVAGVKNQATGLYWAGAAATDGANRIQYSAHGAVSATKLGNGKWEHTNFNSRLQPLQIGLGISSADSSILELDYGYGTTTNNGNVLSQNIVMGGTTISQTYTYDALNRLATASENSGAIWSQNYGYDRYGNRWVSASTGYTLSTLTPQSQGAFNGANNRLFASVYDGAGNQITDSQSRTFIYDAENRQKTFNGTAGQYFYDGDGRRVKKIDNSGTTVFVYNAGGQLIAEYHSDSVPSPAGGGGTSYLTSDHLGSTRVVTKADGTVKARYDYLPFGEELGAGVGARTTGLGYSLADSTKQKFTQKERDNESGLDYFGARYYSSAQGRFTSVDPIMMKKARLIDPQRLNLYVYARSNPLKYVDPNGADIMLAKDLNQKGQEKNRKYVVDNLARLYMTDKGRAYLERADKSQFNIEIGKGKLERHKVGGEKPGTTVFGGSEHVTGGLTSAQTMTDPATGRTTLLASGPAVTEGLIIQGKPIQPITVTIDKDNAAAMGIDPAKVFAHEIGGHVAGMLNLAERPDPNNPNNPSFDLTGRDEKKEEAAARGAEGVGKLPDKPSPEALKAARNC